MSNQPIEVWCHSCGCQMFLREGKYGKFFGCSGYPRCMRTMNLRDASDQHDPPTDEDRIDNLSYDPPDGSD